MDLPKYSQFRWLFHLCFWVLSFYILSRFFSYEKVVTKTDLIYTFLFHLSIWVPVYFNLLVLIPRFLRKERYLIFLTTLGLTFLVAIEWNHWIFEKGSNWLFPDYYFISYYEWTDIARFMAIYLGATTLIKLSKGWFQWLQSEKEIQQIRQQKSEAELSALKAQINPHFLFNSLNSIYSLALDKDAKAPGILLKLSGVLRYMLYDAIGEKVPLQREIENIEDIVALEKIRMDQPDQVVFSVTGKPDGQYIAPLLLIPLVENAFKHHTKNSKDQLFIKIDLETSEGFLFFKVKNSSRKTGKAKASGHHGIGLENIKKRLELIYSKRHQLSTAHTDEWYVVELKLQLK